MALLCRRLRDRLPPHKSAGRRAPDRARGLNSDEPSDSDRGPALDHGIEIRVRQHRLEQRDRNGRLAASGPLTEDATNHALALDFDHLELIFVAVRNGDTALAGTHAEDPRQVMTLFAVDPDRAARDLRRFDERPEHAGLC